MRQPLEDRVITISRAKSTVDYPASFMLVASMNPCPCGFHNHPRISVPLRPNLQKWYLLIMISFRFGKGGTFLGGERTGCKSRSIQAKRFESVKGVYSNSQMSSSMQRRYCQLDETGGKLLKTAMEIRGLSARAYDRILKVARTIADLADSEYIMAEHISEAINYRNLDREGWAG